MQIGRCTATLFMTNLGRFVASDYVHAHFIDKKPWVKALTIVIEGSPLKSALLIAIAEFPFPMKNYPYSVTTAPIWMIVFAQGIMQMPYCCFIVYIGTTSKTLASILNGERDMGAAEITLIILGLCMAVITIALGGYFTTRALNRMVEEQQQKDTEAGVSEFEDATM